MNIYIKNSQYSKLAKLFHWGFVILFAYGVAKQVDNISQLEDLSFFRFEIIFSLIFLALLIIRFIYMKKTQTTSIPEKTPIIQKKLARIVHNSMYVLLAGTAISGLSIGFVYKLGLKNNFLIELLIYVHESIINLLYFFILIHIFGATYHRLKKDGVWSSMVPFFKEKQ